jgi:hypothetical protein
MPKGHFDGDRQLDALAHVIAKDDIVAVAAEWGISRNSVYQLARNVSGTMPSIYDDFVSNFDPSFHHHVMTEDDHRTGRRQYLFVIRTLCQTITSNAR